VNGKHAGETPFSGSVPICSEVKVGREKAHVELKYKQTVKYIYKMPNGKESNGNAEEERRIKEEVTFIAEMAEETQTAWKVGVALGGGMSFNTNEIDPNYYGSTGSQFFLNAEIYKQHIRFFRFGLGFEVGAIGGNNNDGIKRGMTNIEVNTFARLYPVNFLFLSGGAGCGFYWKPKLGNPDVNEVIIAPIFPVGGGIVIEKKSNSKVADAVSLFIEGLYNIIPFQGRTAKYMSINIGFKVDG
jgi:hypothetical protein